MSADSPSVHQELKSAALKILEDGADALVSAARTAVIVEYLGEDTFSQKAVPMIAVARPEKMAEESWGRDHDRREFELPILLIDAMGPKPSDEEDCKERLDILGERLRALFGEAENQNLRLPQYQVFYSMCTWAEGEVLKVGQNLLLKGHLLTVPMIVPRVEPA